MTIPRKAHAAQYQGSNHDEVDAVARKAKPAGYSPSFSSIHTTPDGISVPQGHWLVIDDQGGANVYPDHVYQALYGTESNPFGNMSKQDAERLARMQEVELGDNDRPAGAREVGTRELIDQLRYHFRKVGELMPLLNPEKMKSTVVMDGQEMTMAECVGIVQSTFARTMDFFEKEAQAKGKIGPRKGDLH
ncbi:hypothetical protein [Bordetella flabilis]|uniref:Uncharacterized protein n=1 Tax=Bordetella flabilis TaxID=463014 RepID=A0A193GBF9_9BORD|nr:hypothetical protein [Bordetella flabilis]ANN76796.1 hypothetical protein BAU07_06425 [Bordetella flabilis]